MRPSVSKATIKAKRCVISEFGTVAGVYVLDHNILVKLVSFNHD